MNDYPNATTTRANKSSFQKVIQKKREGQAESASQE